MWRTGVRGNFGAFQQVYFDREVEGFGNLDQDGNAVAHNRLGLGPGNKETIHTDWTPTQWNDCAPMIYGVVLRLWSSLP